MNTKGVFSHNSDEWETPKNIFDDLNSEFNFTLDAAATQKNHKCEKYYTIDDDGLSKSWSNEVVWCNPPYSKVKAWIYKAWEEWFYFDVTTVLLVPVRTDTMWFHTYVKGFAEVRFIRGRLKFSNSKNSAPFPSMIVIFRGVKHDYNISCGFRMRPDMYGRNVCID